MSGFLSKDCLDDDSQLFFLSGNDWYMAGSSSSPQPSSCLSFAASHSAPGDLLLSACVCPDAGLMLGQVQDPSLALSPRTSVEALPWDPASSDEAALASLPPCPIPCLHFRI